MARTTAASTSGSIFCPASCMAVLAKPHAESPPATTPGRFSQISRIRAHNQAMSRGARTPRANAMPGMSATTSALSCTSLPPTDSIERMSAPASALSSNERRRSSQGSPCRIRGGLTFSRISVGVTRKAEGRPLLSCASTRRALRIRVSSAPHFGLSVIGGKCSNSSTRPGAFRRTARATTCRPISS